MNTTLPVARKANELTAALAARHALAILAGTAVIALAAQIAVPFKPVPVTMQTLAVVLVGWKLGGGRGLSAAALYGALGSAGLPIFAAGASGGGPSTGYVIGFVLAAAFVGWMSRENLSGWSALAVFGVGLALPYLPGLIWLSAVTGLGAPWSWPVLSIGVVPFIPGDLFKLGIAASVATAWALRRRR
ncbi:biotin transporter BioY [Trueperella pecoris]|uniref:Biotin transporter n=1 Tax=Trueperella pecoris TaxID=2733571 RepID=A0A7M1QT42_9ACTO|nr:biotin transporter BioY [Trueperella pecoris]QOR45033.1 biotin transporter BioY [Trueperella pecoris]